MQSLPLQRSGSNPGQETAGPAADAGSPADPQERRIRIAGRYWSTQAPEARYLPECPICFEGLAQHHLCEDTDHAVCAECLPGLVGLHERCQTCRKPFEQPSHRSVRDQTLHKALRPLFDAVVVRCMECRQWSGPMARVESHLRVCGKQMHPCRWTGSGCEWTGLLEDLDGHETLCRWRPAVCSLTGCGARLPLCQKPEHEARCDYGPAWLGALKTNRLTLRRLEASRQFCQARGRSSVPLPLADRAVRRQCETLVALFPLLYEAVEKARLPGESVPQATGRPADPVAATISGAARVSGAATISGAATAPDPEPERRAAPGGRSHAGTYGRCRFCRRDGNLSVLDIHMSLCPERPALCANGCGEPGLRAGDITSGHHALHCARRPWPCSWCAQRIPVNELQGHQATCRARTALDCAWCLGRHEDHRFQEQSAACRRNTPETLHLGPHQLVLSAQAMGAVYVVGGAEGAPELDSCVFIRFSAATLGWAIHSRVLDVNLTPALLFDWSRSHRSCKLAMFYRQGAGDDFFSLRVSYAENPLHIPPGRQCLAAVRLYTMDASLVEEIGTRRAGRPEKSVALQARQTEVFLVTAVNSLALTEQDVVLQLGPVVLV